MSRPATIQRPPRLANSSFGPRARKRPLISLTPLIDVVFILLIFFMLASSFLDWRAIDLSAPGRAASGGGMEGALVVDVRQDALRLSGEAVSLDQLAARVRERVAAKPDQRILVRPADGVILQRTVTVLDLLSSSGVTQLSLIRSGER